MISNAEFHRLIDKGHIDAGDVLALRKAMYGDDFLISLEEAEALFRLNDVCSFEGPEWPEFFIEALVDFSINQAEPKGYISNENADWLVAQVARDGRVKSATEMELLAKVMDSAQRVPDALQLYVMNEVKQAVLTGTGPMRGGAELSPGRIGRAEVDLLRRVLYACGGGDGIAISRREAEMLFDINDAVTDVTNDASWTDLFIKAVANYLMASRGYQALSREEALRREAWLDSDEPTGVGAFFGKIMAGGLRGILSSYEEADHSQAARRTADIAMAEVVSADEADWLVDRIGRDGAFDDTEKALLMFIKAESPDIHPQLKPLLDQVA